MLLLRCRHEYTGPYRAQVSTERRVTLAGHRGRPGSVGDTEHGLRGTLSSAAERGLTGHTPPPHDGEHHRNIIWRKKYVSVDGSSVPEDRRVELLLFEEGHEPDLAVMNEEPKVSEFYMRDALVREEIARRPGGVTSTVDL